MPRAHEQSESHKDWGVEIVDGVSPAAEPIPNRRRDIEIGSKKEKQAGDDAPGDQWLPEGEQG